MKLETHQEEIICKNLCAVYSGIWKYDPDILKEFTVSFEENGDKGSLGYYMHSKHKIVLTTAPHTNIENLMRTAIHELAHHVDHCLNPKLKLGHNKRFADIHLHLRGVAKGQNIIRDEPSNRMRGVLDSFAIFKEDLVKYLTSSEEDDQVEELQEYIGTYLTKPLLKKIIAT